MRRGWNEFVTHQQKSASVTDAVTVDDVGDNVNSPAANSVVVRLDALVCNAGALDNERTVSKEGIEVTFAAHLLFGTYLLGKLALPSLNATPESRLIAVSSGGMYNVKFPEWTIATSTGAAAGSYNGQLAYAYAKRGQVLLCEKWAETHPGTKIVSCHPGWVDTAGVEAAYGESKKWLAPLRNLWEGVEGIVWLAVAPAAEIHSGAFYLDRAPCVKHLAGPFFTEGSYTKNTPAQVDIMMENLELWSDKTTRPLAAVEIANTAAGTPNEK